MEKLVLRLAGLKHPTVSQKHLNLCMTQTWTEVWRNVCSENIYTPKPECKSSEIIPTEKRDGSREMGCTKVASFVDDKLIFNDVMDVDAVCPGGETAPESLTHTAD